MYPIVSITDNITTKQEHQEQELTSEAEEKPLLPKKKKPRKRPRPCSDDEQVQTEAEDRSNKLEENPQQVRYIFQFNFLFFCIQLYVVRYYFKILISG